MYRLLLQRWNSPFVPNHLQIAPPILASFSFPSFSAPSRTFLFFLLRRNKEVLIRLWHQLRDRRSDATVLPVKGENGVKEGSSLPVGAKTRSLSQSPLAVQEIGKICSSGLLCWRGFLYPLFHSIIQPPPCLFF